MSRNVIVVFLFLFCAFSLMGQRAVNTVVIDPGHGGSDPGAIGSRYKEKDLVLDIALKLGGYIKEHFDDVEVIYTRKTDVFVPLWKRTEIANKNQADLFISIHCNAASSRSAYGFETFVMGLHRSEANLKVAQQENASILLEDNYMEQYEGFNPNSPEAYIIFSLYQHTYRNQSITFAELVQDQFRERMRRKDRGVKQAGFLVLYGTTMPGVLIEAGFLSNPQEEAFIGSEQGQTYIASAIFRAFRDYKSNVEKDIQIQQEDTPLIAGQESDPVTENPDNPNNNHNPDNPKGNNDQQEDNIFFSVQFFASSQRKNIEKDHFEGLGEVKSYYEGGLHKYYVGNEKTLNKASLLQHEIQKLGYNGAFVIAFHNGERISVGEASRRMKQLSTSQ